MGASFPIVENFAFIAEEKLGSVQKFRWSCLCRQNSLPSRDGTWQRNLWTVLEAFRQHWQSVHPDREAIDWDRVYKRVPWLSSAYERAEDGRWVDAKVKLDPMKIKVDLDPIKMAAFAKLYGASEAKITQLAQEGEKIGMARWEDIQKRMRDLEAEAARYGRFPRTDEWPVNTVLVYDQEAPSGEVYTYGVLKCKNGSWYWIGHGLYTKTGASYDHLIEHLAHERTSNIRIAMPKHFEPLFPEATPLADVIGEDAAAKVEAFLAAPETGVKVERPAKSERPEKAAAYIPNLVKRADG